MAGREDENLQLRLILNKPGNQRSYDDLLSLRSRISQMDLLKSTFAGLHPRQVDELCRNLGIEVFHMNDVVFNQGDAGDKFYIVLSGTCVVKVKNTIVEQTSGESEVREKVLFECNEGQHFGERALEFNEPRAASVVCTSYCELLTLTNYAYTKILKAYQEESGLVKLSADNKASIMRVLSKSREKRSEAELLAVAAYLERRNHFFQKFTSDQRLELCRVSELISIYGRNTLFKQGQIGQAFYVILSGSVDVFVNSVDTEDASLVKTGSDGILVNTLVSGASFGERALDSASCQRTASVLTCEGLTELLVISREDYHAIVSVMMQEETAEKCGLLRQTLLFKDAPFFVLRELSKYMEQKIFHIDSFLTTAGSKALDIIIIREGECQVELDVEHFCNVRNTNSALNSRVATPDAHDYEYSTAAAAVAKKPAKSQYRQSVVYSHDRHREVVRLGRVGPGAVLCTHITTVKGMHQDTYHSENTQATTIVEAFVVAKNDFFHHLSADTRAYISQLVRDFKPPHLAKIWDAGPRPMGETEWRLDKAWKTFRRDMMSGKKNSNILLNHAHAKNFSLALPAEALMLNLKSGGTQSMMLTPSATGSGSMPVDSDTQKAQAMVQLTKYELHMRHREEARKAREVQAAKDREEMKRFTPLSRREVADQEAKERLAHMTTGSGLMDAPANATPTKEAGSPTKTSKTSPKGKSVLLSPTGPVSSSYKYPFSLVHIHREKVKYRAGTGPRRLVKCYFRLCGMSQSCSDAIKAAEALMLNAFITMLNSNIDKAPEIYLNWKPFVGFESCPLHHTDHFFIYCRTAPMQYASLTPSVNLLNFVFPSVCKLKGQRYATISTRSLTDITKPVSVARAGGSGPSTAQYVAAPKLNSVSATGASSANLGGGGDSGSNSKDRQSAAAAPSLAPPHLARRAGSRRASMANVKRKLPSSLSFNGSRPDSPSTETEEETEAQIEEGYAKEDEELKFPSVSSVLAAPLFLKEIGFLHEVHQCSGAVTECLKFAKFYGHFNNYKGRHGAAPGANGNMQLNRRGTNIGGLGQSAVAATDPLSDASIGAAAAAAGVNVTSAPANRMCVVPMYLWIEVSEFVLAHYDRDRLNESNLEIETSANNIPNNVNSRFNASSSKEADNNNATISSALAHSTSEAVKLLSDAFAEAGLPMALGHASSGVTGRGFKDACAHGISIVGDLRKDGDEDEGSGPAKRDGIKRQMITDDISYKLLNEEVQRKRLHDEITASALSQQQNNDHGFVHGMNSSMNLLNHQHPHFLTVDAVAAAKKEQNAELASHAASAAGTGQSTSRTEGATKAGTPATTSDAAAGGGGGGGPGKGLASAMPYRQVSFSGFTDSVMSIKESMSAAVAAAGGDDNAAQPTPTAGGAPTATTSAPTPAAATPPQNNAPFVATPGIASQCQVSVFQVKGAMAKQRNHEIQEAAVAAIHESTARIEDRMEALKRVTDTRMKVLSMHDDLCSTEKEISTTIHKYKTVGDGKKGKNKHAEAILRTVFPERNRSSSGKPARSSRFSMRAKGTSEEVGSDEDEDTDAEMVELNAGFSRSRQMSGLFKTHSESGEGMAEMTQSLPNLPRLSKIFGSQPSSKFSERASSNNSDDEDDDEGTDHLRPMPAKGPPMRNAGMRRSSSAMIIEAMSNMGSATIVDTSSISQGNDSATHQPGLGEGDDNKDPHQRKPAAMNPRVRRQLDKSKRKVMTQRMELLDQLIHLPSTKAVETELRAKRYGKSLPGAGLGVSSSSMSASKSTPNAAVGLGLEGGSSTGTSSARGTSRSSSANALPGGSRSGGSRERADSKGGSAGGSGKEAEVKEVREKPSLNTKLEVLEMILNKRNGIATVHPSVIEDLGFVENVIPLSEETSDLYGTGAVALNSGE